jgi:hypothetical protein
MAGNYDANSLTGQGSGCPMAEAKPTGSLMDGLARNKRSEAGTLKTGRPVVSGVIP